MTEKTFFGNRKSTTCILAVATFLLVLFVNGDKNVPRFLGFLIGWFGIVIIFKYLIIKKFSKFKDVSNIFALNSAMFIYLIVLLILSVFIVGNNNTPQSLETSAEKDYKYCKEMSDNMIANGIAGGWIIPGATDCRCDDIGYVLKCDGSCSCVKSN